MLLTFKTPNNLQIELVLSLIHGQLSSMGNIVVKTDEVNDSITLSGSKDSENIEVESDYIELLVPSDIIVLVGAQGEDCESHYMYSLWMP